MRRRRKPGALEKYLSFKEYIIEGENNEEILENINRFVGDRDLEIELGSGCTGFLIEHASQNPEKVYIAIEFKEELLLKAAQNAKEKELTNIKFLRHRIEKLESVFENIKATGLYLNFSDPWPKQRHTKRRLTHLSYLELYKKILKDGGLIEFKTDNNEFFDFSLKQFQLAELECLEISRDLHKEKDNLIMTEYEKKYSGQGKKINYAKVFYKK